MSLTLPARTELAVALAPAAAGPGRAGLLLVPGLVLALAGVAMLHRGWSPARVLGLVVLGYLPQLPYAGLDLGPAAVVLALPGLVLVLGMGRLSSIVDSSNSNS